MFRSHEKRPRDQERGQLRNAITRSRYNHTQLANELGIHPSTFSEKMNQNAPFYDHELMALSTLLSISVDQILFGAPFKRHDIYHDLLRHLDRYSEDTTRDLVEFLRIIAPEHKQPRFKTGRDRLRHRLINQTFNLVDLSDHLNLHPDVFRRKLKNPKDPFTEYQIMKLCDAAHMTADQILFGKLESRAARYDELLQILENYSPFTATALAELIEQLRRPGLGDGFRR